LAINIGRNVIHGSDGPDTAVEEIALWFAASELSDWNPADQIWRTEQA
jgi:nucleoside-diphosphate kinase